ncbi:MAG: metallophosphatase family protein [Bacteroidales bacterium]|nr:metallophosphatase family protein [Bacteroidales bacterium]MDE7102277.1 metallophosphatase family protein [Bacteroidales bacterium]MDE7338357.1 metallophosphatase family protein [Bacteroidales bacterium]MDE7357671.1 metallophosphatase family protein [Bacteroidales bacterium]
MKIGILSDTHGELPLPVRRFLEPCAHLCHAGDIGGLPLLDELSAFKPITAVFGNIDDWAVRRTCPQTAVFSIENCKVLMTHIGGYPGRYAPGISSLLEQEKPDLFIAGHSHILKIMPDTKRGFLYINPGAAGCKGFHSRITAVRLDVEGKKFSNLEVFDLERSAYVRS